MLTLSDICEEEEEEEEDDGKVMDMMEHDSLQRDESTCHLIRPEKETFDPIRTCDSEGGQIHSSTHRPALGELHANGTVSQRYKPTDGYSIISQQIQKSSSSSRQRKTKSGSLCDSNSSNSNRSNHIVTRISILPSYESYSIPGHHSKHSSSAKANSEQTETCNKDAVSATSVTLVNGKTSAQSSPRNTQPAYCVVDMSRTSPSRTASSGDPITISNKVCSSSMDSLPTTTPSDSCSQTSTFWANEKSDAPSPNYSFKDEEDSYYRRAMIPFHEVKRGLTRKQILQLSAMSGCGFILVTIIILWVMSPALF